MPGRDAPVSAPAGKGRPGAGIPRGVLGSLLALGLAACAVGPEYETPALPLPGHWGAVPRTQVEPTHAEAAPNLKAWWRRMGDPVLDALMDEAVAGNLDVATAKANVRAARASYRQQVGALFPQVTGNASGTRGANGGRVGSGGDVTVDSGYGQYQAGLDASWEIDLFGANRRGVEAAVFGVDASVDDLDAALLTLVGDVASNYADARGYQAQIALARRTAASQRETEALTRRRLDAGAVSALDVANASGQVASTEANIPEIEAALAASVHRLSVLIGQPPATLARRMAVVRAVPSPRLPVPRGIPADVLASRPDVRAAERRLGQSTALIGQAEANRYPAISLTGNINATGTQLGDLGRASSISWAFGPSLTVPIFTGGQLKAAVDLAEAGRDQSFIAYKASVLTALEEVENASVSLAQQRIRTGKLSSSSASYREAARLSRSLYENGASSFLDVLTAERSLYSAETQLIQSRVATAKSYIALNKALGGGWDGMVDTSAREVVDGYTGPHFARLKLSASQ
ncbi:efflux transporter outer membrane subunit [Xanthobacter autotrophicus]|uniref:efflux transporter outer membrane subunit n=1 Tax=Xanthobacter autotrophicus TaxID=280 RepID=UPI0024A733D5|nr:efflux transporter outer membrane subunit [Xanthobacter autotrophicus]MDI4655460.1 efflux transporter outer membrane subunit [Xanthobacter autotrophicus]